MAQFSFTNTPEGGISANRVQNTYSEEEDQIAGLEIEGTITDGDLIQYNGSDGVWNLVTTDSTQNVITVEDGGTEDVSDLSTLNFTSNIDVTDAGSGVADIALGSAVLLDANTQFSIQSVSSASNTNGNVLNLLDASGGTFTLTISTADANDGAIVAVSEFDGTNSATVATEGSATVNGSTTDTIATGSSKVYAYDDSRSDWTVIATG